MNSEEMPAKDFTPATPAILRALRKAGGRVTVGDAVAATGHPRDQVEATLRSLLESRRGHLEVGEAGTLVYRFDPKLIQRDAEPLARRLARGSWAAFREAFKVWIVLMLVVYFVVFVALLIAALVASQSRGGGRGRGRGISLGRRGGGGGFPSFWFWYFFWRPGWGWRRPYYGHRWERRYGTSKGEPKVPFIKKVFAFVFGPDVPHPTQAQKDQEMARLMAAYAGDVKVTREGVLTYVFPELMVSAGGRVSERDPDPAWRRLEPSESVTGNEKKSNALIGGMNGFNLVAAISAPWIIFPQLGFGGPLAWIGLVWIPAVFSALFFAVPLLRLVAVRSRNRRRQARNLRKVLLGHVLQASLTGRGVQWITAAGALERARPLLLPSGRRTTRGKVAEYDTNLPDELGWDRAFQERLQELLAEFDGEVEETPGGTVRYRFPEIRRQFQGAETTRRVLQLEAQEVGEIVYASDQTREEADQREVEEFEREMERAEDLERYLQSPDRVEYFDEFELVSFDEELAQRRAISA
jgi:hypothetical protein